MGLGFCLVVFLKGLIRVANIHHNFARYSLASNMSNRFWFKYSVNYSKFRYEMPKSLIIQASAEFFKARTVNNSSASISTCYYHFDKCNY